MAANNYLPLFIDMSSRKVLIFGGGQVGERKAFFFRNIAPVVVVSTSFTDRLASAADGGELELVRRDLDALSDEDLDKMVNDCFLVITATSDPALNERLAEAGSRAGVLVNSVDFAGDVVIPSVIRQESVLIGISTGGHGPALSRYTRLQLEKVITPAYGRMARLQDECREFLKEHVEEEAKRKAILWDILENDAIWEALDVSYEKAYNIAYGIIQGHTGVSDG